MRRLPPNPALVDATRTAVRRLLADWRDGLMTDEEARVEGLALYRRAALYERTGHLWEARGLRHMLEQLGVEGIPNARAGT